MAPYETLLCLSRCANAIHKVNPNLLIAVQGLDVYKGQYGLWGGVFLGQLDAPLNLTVPNKLIFETHDLGPSTFNQVRNVVPLLSLLLANSQHPLKRKLSSSLFSPSISVVVRTGLVQFPITPFGSLQSPVL